MVWIILLGAISVTLLLTAVFFGKELLKKFRFHDQFTDSDGYIQKIIDYWPGGKPFKMQKVALQSNKPFKALIGFKLEIPLIKFKGTDWYGFADARLVNGKWLAVFSTYLGKHPIENRFFVNKPDPNEIVQVVPQSEVEDLEPDTVCKPHWYQRLLKVFT